MWVFEGALTLEQELTLITPRCKEEGLLMPLAMGI